MPRILQIRTGRPQDVRGVVTAYGRQLQTGPIAASTDGLAGDEVADTRAHGGPDKAILGYAAGNYPLWSAELPHHAARFVPGAFGENLLVEGLDEASACIGDQWRIGDALVEICQPRRPCATVGHWFEDPSMLKAMVRTQRTGWYMRVLEPGLVQTGEIHLEHRPLRAWPVARVLELSYRTPPDTAGLAELMDAPGLAENWVNKIRPLLPEPRA